jgi:hypothetical protein
MSLPRDGSLTREEREAERFPSRGIHPEKAVEGAVLSLTDITPGAIGVAAANHGHLKHNLGAVAAPTVDDDELVGYSVGSIWIDISTPKAYICIDASEGAADWNQIDAGGGGGDIASDTIWDALGDMVYGSADDTGAKLAGNTTATKKYLTQTGDGAASAAPGWNVIADADVPASLACPLRPRPRYRLRYPPRDRSGPGRG